MIRKKILPSLGGGLSITPDWSEKRFPERPSQKQSHFYRLTVDADTLTLDHHRHRAIADVDHAIVSFISALRCGARPATVARLIIAVIIFSIQRVALWRPSHISEKKTKIGPSFADFDPSSAIVPKVGVVWIQASSSHFTPRAMRAPRVRIVSQPMCFVESSGDLRSPTTTTLRSPVYQRGCRDMPFGPAITFTQPPRRSVGRAFHPSDSCPTSEATARKVAISRHTVGIPLTPLLRRDLSQVNVEPFG